MSFVALRPSPFGTWPRPSRGVALALALSAAWASVAAAAVPRPAQDAAPVASYRVELERISPPRYLVSASLPCDGRALEMSSTRPGDLPELGDGGWPVLVSDLRVADSTGAALAVSGPRPAGWTLDRPYTGRLTIRYVVDDSLLAARGWPAPREAASTDPGTLVQVGRSLFLTTPATGRCGVRFVLPGDWRAVTPWEPGEGAEKSLLVCDAQALVENLVVLSRNAPDVVDAGGFRLSIVPMGHWRAARREVRRSLRAVLPRLVRMMGSHERTRYLVVLLPRLDAGGEGYRQSFALTVDSPSAQVDPALWGNTLAHEIFHHWNGWELRGADYASSQWFQEGFTEYAANLAMVTSGMTTPEQFAHKLGEHVRNYRRLSTTLEAIGTHKGPPLYSGGALVAFSWDVSIREASGGRRDLGDFLRCLWRQTDGGRRRYAWPDIRAALDATAPGGWDAFREAHLSGSTPLPLERTLADVGMRLRTGADSTLDVVPDPSAAGAAKERWRALVKGRG